MADSESVAIATVPARWNPTFQKRPINSSGFIGHVHDRFSKQITEAKYFQ